MVVVGVAMVAVVAVAVAIVAVAVVVLCVRSGWRCASAQHRTPARTWSSGGAHTGSSCWLTWLVELNVWR